LAQVLEPIAELYHYKFKTWNFWFLTLKYFFDIDGLFWCLQNDGNSPPKKIFSYTTNNYSNVFKKEEG